MKRTRVVVIVLVFVILGGVLANAAVRSRTNGRVTGPTSGLIRATRTWARGPSAHYGLDYGNIGTVGALQLTLPGGSNNDVVLTVSLNYRTSPPPDTFSLGVWVREGAQFGPLVPTMPKTRSLTWSTVDASSTQLFQIADLQGGITYWLTPTVNVSDRHGMARIVSSRVLLVVDATPS